MSDKKVVERKCTVVDFRHEDFEFTVKLAKYVDEHTDILESIEFQRKCLDFVNEITTMTARAYAVKVDKEYEENTPPWEESEGEKTDKEKTDNPNIIQPKKSHRKAIMEEAAQTE